MATDYHQHDDLLNKSFEKKPMIYRDKKKLVQLIDKLETKDHLGILRIIKDSTEKKIYTVNNYGTYIDLDDIDNMTLWKIQYYVNLCLDNLTREKTKTQAEQEHEEQIKKLETDLRNKSKLKLSLTNRTKTPTQKEKKNTKATKNSDDSDDSDLDIPTIHRQSNDDLDETDLMDLPDGLLPSTSLGVSDFSPLSSNIEEYDLDPDFEADEDL
jgi:hypothetical protein